MMLNKTFVKGNKKDKFEKNKLCPSKCEISKNLSNCDDAEEDKLILVPSISDTILEQCSYLTSRQKKNTLTNTPSCIFQRLV